MSNYYDDEDNASHSDGSEDSELTDQEIVKHDLHDHISQIHSAGSFATFGRIEDFSHPGVSVDPIGILRLPLSEDDARALARASHQAPFGYGTQTLVDETVRKTWEIDATKVIFNNQGWKLCLDRVVEEVAEGLGVIGGSTNIRAEFYKMLLYEKGAMFKPHRDTEKVRGMFGTLVICLPSEHTGGTVCLEHGKAQAKFSTSEFSAFDASFIAWYADVVHEIEPVQSGYRWVLTYNLINESKGYCPSVSVLDARVQDFKQLLTQWQNLGQVPQFFAYPLAHRYTSTSLRLPQLKGDDYYRARHAVQSCSEQREFYIFLANIETCFTDPNDEDETLPMESDMSITRIVDPDGFNLTLYDRLSVSDGDLVRQMVTDDRNPDVQRGGGYMGNSYAEIEQFYMNSILILVPKRSVISILLERNTSVHYIHMLRARLTARMNFKIDDSTSRELLLQLYQTCISTDHQNLGFKKGCLGTAAVIAVLLKDASLFTKCVERATEGFDKLSYSALGEMIMFQDLVVPEDHLRKAVTSSGTLTNVYDNLRSFYAGFHRGNPDANFPVQTQHLKAWIDSVMFESFNHFDHAHKEDAKTLIQIILERSQDSFSQFILYQGMTKFIDRLYYDGNLTIPLMVLLINQLEAHDRSQKYFYNLLQRIMERIVSDLDLPQYFEHFDAFDHMWANDRPIKTRDPSLWIRPLKKFYDFFCVHSQSDGARFLDRIQTQASRLKDGDIKDFLVPLLEEMIPIIDASSSHARDFVKSLLTVYITRTVGKEPKRPIDWARPEEAKEPCWGKHDTCHKIDEFLKDAESKAHELSDDDDDQWHLRHRYHSLQYFEVEYVNHKIVTLTKTLKWYEEHQRKWEDRASLARKTLQKLPQEELRQFLEDHFDEIMEFRMVKLDNGSDLDSGDTSQGDDRHLYETISSVPQKRSWSDTACADEEV